MRRPSRPATQLTDRRSQPGLGTGNHPSHFQQCFEPARRAAVRLDGWALRSLLKGCRAKYLWVSSIHKLSVMQSLCADFIETRPCLFAAIGNL